MCLVEIFVLSMISIRHSISLMKGRAMVHYRSWMVWYKALTLFLCCVSNPTFTGLYIYSNVFCPRRYKINLIYSSVYRALFICYKNNLKQELDSIRKYFVIIIILCNLSLILWLHRSITLNIWLRKKSLLYIKSLIIY